MLALPPRVSASMAGQRALAVGSLQTLPACLAALQHCESRGVNDRHALDLLEKLLALNPAARIRAQHAFMVSRAAGGGQVW